MSVSLLKGGPRQSSTVRQFCRSRAYLCFSYLFLFVLIFLWFSILNSKFLLVIGPVSINGYWNGEVYFRQHDIIERDYQESLPDVDVLPEQKSSHNVESSTTDAHQKIIERSSGEKVSHYSSTTASENKGVGSSDPRVPDGIRDVPSASIYDPVVTTSTSPPVAIGVVTTSPKPQTSCDWRGFQDWFEPPAPLSEYSSHIFFPHTHLGPIFHTIFPCMSSWLASRTHL